ncbi:MAG: 3D (Asp-Asp-Asp) domain-containing protein [Verrucomicrobiales bacterium]|jgi:3D (Asp-Asp-Asp) domain-containing protein
MKLNSTSPWLVAILVACYFTSFSPLRATESPEEPKTAESRDSLFPRLRLSLDFLKAEEDAEEIEVAETKTEEKTSNDAPAPTRTLTQPTEFAEAAKERAQKLKSAIFGDRTKPEPATSPEIAANPAPKSEPTPKTAQPEQRKLIGLIGELAAKEPAPKSDSPTLPKLDLRSLVSKLAPEPTAETRQTAKTAIATSTASASAKPQTTTKRRPSHFGPRTVRTTAYTHTESDHKAWGRQTASGGTLQSTTSYTSAAADWSRFPLGTIFRIRGESTVYVVDDYGSALVGSDTIDIYQPNRTQMDNWGVRHVDIEIIKRGCFVKSKKILGGRLHIAHCEQMYRQIDPLNS